MRVGGRDGPAPPRSLFSLAFTTQMIVTTPSQSFSQASQPAGHVFDASSTGGHCCCCALGTAVRWLPLELATAHCYGNCWRPQQPPPQGGERGREWGGSGSLVRRISVGLQGERTGQELTGGSPQEAGIARVRGGEVGVSLQVDQQLLRAAVPLAAVVPAVHPVTDVGPTCDAVMSP